MASFGVNQADSFGGQGGGGYFSLKNDGDTARVRFLYRDIEDVQGYSVHEVVHNGKKRYVNCLREYGDPISACPMCESGNQPRVKYFIPLYNVDTGTSVTWERGKQFGSKLSSLCSHYPNLVQHTFEIERHGAQGSTSTTYDIYENGVDETVDLDDFTVEHPLGGLILDKTAEEMQTYLRTGAFPSEGGAPEGGFQRRQPQQERRTPNGDGGRRQVF